MMMQIKADDGVVKIMSPVPKTQITNKHKIIEAMEKRAKKLGE